MFDNKDNINCRNTKMITKLNDDVRKVSIDGLLRNKLFCLLT